MRAAQYPVDLLVHLATAMPAWASGLITALPEWLRVAVAVLLTLLFAARFCLRMLDEHLDARTTREQITRGQDWLEVVRIRQQPRRLFGRAEAAPPCGAPSGLEGDGGPREGPRPRGDGTEDGPGDDPS